MSTNNFIFNFSNKEKNQEQKIYASYARRNIANLIDIHITLLLRAIFVQIIFILIFNKIADDFIDDLYNTYGTKSLKNTPDHINFLINHSIFIHSILLIIATIMLGAVYHAYFNSSNWQATPGKRIAGIIISKNNSKISFLTGLYYYFLSLIPYLFVVFLVYCMKKYNLGIYEIFIQKKSIATAGILILIASHCGAFNKKHLNFFDYLVKVNLYREKTKFRFPFSNNKSL